MEIGNKIHSCSQCGYSTTKLSNLKRHFLAHTGEKPLKCDQCSQTFTLKHHLKNHTKAKHSEFYSCKQCDEIVKHVDAHAHKALHGKFYCDFCDCVCDIKNKRRHLRNKHKNITPSTTYTHTGEKPSCAHCGKNFFDSSNLKRHIVRMHTGTLPPHQEANFPSREPFEKGISKTSLTTTSGNEALKAKKSVSFPDIVVTEVLEIPFTKVSLDGMTSELCDFFDELEKPMTLAHNRKQNLLCTELVEAYERNSRKAFDVHKFRILATFGLYTTKIGPRGLEVFVADIGKMDSSIKSIRQKHLIREVQLSGNYVDLIDLPEPVVEKYTPALQMIQENILPVAPLPIVGEGPKTLLDRVRRRQAEKAHRANVFNSVDWQLQTLPELARICNCIFVSERKRVMQLPKLLEKIGEAGFTSVRPVSSDLERLISETDDFLSIPIPGFVRRNSEVDINKVCSDLKNIK